MKSISIMYTIHKSSNEIFVDFNSIHDVIFLKQWLRMCPGVTPAMILTIFFFMIYKIQLVQVRYISITPEMITVA